MTTLVGGVSQLYQGDLDLGRIVVGRLGAQDLGHDIVVEDLHYGAIAVTQRLEELAPDTLVLVGAEARGRPPAAVERRRVDPPSLSRELTQVAVGDAVTGYVSIDLIVEVAAGLQVLPQRTIAIEVEPVDTDPCEELSAPATAVLDEVLRLTRDEARRGALLRLADQIRRSAFDGHLDPSPALDVLRSLLDQLAILDREGRWAATFAQRDALRTTIAAGDTGEAMTHLDWALWWGLIEEIDRLQALDVEPV
jgi:hypothetical protein